MAVAVALIAYGGRARDYTRMYEKRDFRTKARVATIGVRDGTNQVRAAKRGTRGKVRHAHEDVYASWLRNQAYSLR